MQQKSHRIAGIQWLLSCPLSQILNHRRISEQARDFAVDIDVHVLGGWMLRQARHRQDVARQRDDEACAGADAELLDRDAETGRTADLRRIVRQGILRLGHTLFAKKRLLAVVLLVLLVLLLAGILLGIFLIGFPIFLLHGTNLLSQSAYRA